MANVYYKGNKLKQLKGFYYTAQFQSVSLAADFMCLTQPAVSLQVKSLEEQLGYKLFYRTTNKMLLTNQGKQLQYRVKSIIDSIEDIYTTDDKKQNKKIHIVANNASLNYIVPKVVKLFTTNEPTCKIHLDYATGTAGLDKLSRPADIFFTPLNFPLDHNKYQFTLIKAFPVALITHKTHPLAKLDNITLADIVKYSVIMPPDDLSVLPSIHNVFKTSGNKLNCNVRLTNWELTKRYVEEGIAITISSQCIILDKDNDLFVYPLDKHFSKVKYGYVSLKSKTHSELVRSFMHIAKHLYE